MAQVQDTLPPPPPSSLPPLFVPRIIYLRSRTPHRLRYEFLVRQKQRERDYMVANPDGNWLETLRDPCGGRICSLREACEPDDGLALSYPLPDVWMVPLLPKKAVTFEGGETSTREDALNLGMDRSSLRAVVAGAMGWGAKHSVCTYKEKAEGASAYDGYW